jgi:tRNA pseudouridine38-40 synthase
MSESGTNDKDQVPSDMKDHKRKAETQGDDTAAAAAANSAAGGADGKNERGNNNNNNNNKRSKGKKVWPKKEIKFSHRKQNSEKELVDQHPHAGSFANKELREQFGVDLGDLLEPKKDDDANNDETTKKDDDGPKKSKKRAAFLLGYLGTNYGGFQINEGQRTLQAELELALVKSKLLTVQNFGYPSKYGWSTSGRTDKGVHAAAQVVSAKIELAPDQTMDHVRESLNDKLPEDIRVLDVVKVTRSFCAKTSRDRVRYQYMIPSFALFGPDALTALFEKVCDKKKDRSPADPLSPEEVAELFPHLKDFRASEKHLEKLRAALSVYEGTHSFHNYARGVNADEGRSARYITSFNVETPVVFANGMEWIPTQVTGQSFLLNQIRKMVSMAMDVARGAAPLALVETALSKNKDVRVNIAPSQGLFLEMSFYGGYNQHKQVNPDLRDLDFSDETTPAYQRWKDFRNGTLMPHVVEEEEREGNFIKYLYIQDSIFNYRKMYQEHVAELDKEE